MRPLICLLFTVSTIGWLAAVAQPEPAANLPTAATPVPAAPAAAISDLAKPGTLSPADRLQYARLIRTELELNAQLRLLAELLEERLSRSDQFARSAAPERAQWEAELARDLRSRNSVVLGQLNELTKQRLAFEAAHVPASTPGLGTLDDGKLNLDESAYVSRLDERLLKVRQELAALDDSSRGLAMQLQTNTTVEAVGRIQVMIEENTRRAAQWEREHSELELKKLEFRALRK